MKDRLKIAVVDDDPKWVAFVASLLNRQGHEVTRFSSAGKFFDSLVKTHFSLLVLDMNLPGMHGREIIRVVRVNPETRRMLIVGLSDCEVQSSHAVEALNAGADEYLPKPVDVEFLAARVAALLRRHQESKEPDAERLCVGSLVVLPAQQEASVAGKKVALTNLEFQLLLYFLRNANRVLTRQLILDQVWGIKTPMDTRTVDKHVESLRRKLGDVGKRFETVVKVGYLLKV